MAKNKKKKDSQPQVRISPERYMREHVRKLPIDQCYISEGWENSGLAVVIVSRKKKNGNRAASTFLVDSFCLGVKDVSYWTDLDEESFEELIDGYSQSLTLKECTYAEAHNFVLGAVEFAEEAGIEPHKDFDIASLILEEDTDDIPLIEYEYGKDGKRMLIVGPTGKETRYIKSLQERFGDDFDYIVDADDDDEDEEYGSYDDEIEEYGSYDDEEDSESNSR